MAGKEFHRGTVRGKKLNLKVSVEVERCLYFFLCDDLVLLIAGVKLSAAGMSIKSLTTLKNKVIWILALLDSSDSHWRC